SRAELTAYYRAKGFAPFQTQFDSKKPSPFLGGMGGASKPTVADIGEAVFNLLDADRDGKLTRQELAAAPAVLLRMDENDDDMVTPQELVPNPKKDKLGGGGKGMMNFMKGASGPAENPYVVTVATRGKAPANLVQRLQAKYGPKDAPKDL